ncbi:hypothetical protein EDC04DRAFT_289492 [Pisolithus marmoratus]|nr:hypothetical protein EDC04DRAFT_289492 [Pisolithus marmoratus]
MAVLPLGEAGAEREDSAMKSHSLKRNVLGSHVFGQEEAGKERVDADRYNSSPKRDRNEFEMEVFQTSATVTEQEDTDPQGLPFESEPNICGIHATTEPPSLVSQVSMSNSSARTHGDNSSLVPPGTNLEPQRTSLISKLAKIFRRRKPPQGTKEKRGASPKIVHVAQFNVVSP